MTDTSVKIDLHGYRAREAWEYLEWRIETLPIIVCPNHHLLIHKLNPVFNPDDRCFEYPDGTKEKIKIDYICR